MTTDPKPDHGLKNLPEKRRYTVAPEDRRAIGGHLFAADAAAIHEELAVTNVGCVLDAILEQLVEASQILVELHPITKADDTAAKKALCCVSLALGSVNLLVPRLPEPS